MPSQANGVAGVAAAFEELQKTLDTVIQGIKPKEGTAGPTGCQLSQQAMAALAAATDGAEGLPAQVTADDPMGASAHAAALRSEFERGVELKSPETQAFAQTPFAKAQQQMQEKRAAAERGVAAGAPTG